MVNVDISFGGHPGHQICASLPFAIVAPVLPVLLIAVSLIRGGGVTVVVMRRPGGGTASAVVHWTAVAAEV
jgi:hypothetical protein